MERKNEPTRKPLSFVKTAVAPPPSREERTPLSFVKTAVASPPSREERTPLSFVKTAVASPTPQPSPVPQPSPILRSSPVPGAILPDSDVANALRTSLVAAAFGVNSPTAQASFAGVDATFDVAALRDGKAPETLDLTVVDAALMDATRALETLASRLEPNFNPRADAALREVWTRLDAAVGATNDALRETFLTQALNALNSTISRLKGGRLLTALLAKAAVECRFGRLAAALSTLNDVAATRCPLAQATQDKAFYWNRLRVAMEARDVLAALTGRPLWADVWRERAEFFKGWASSPTPTTAERDEAFEIWRATELLTTDLCAAEEALRRAAFGKTQSLNVEAAALYEKTFGEKPSKPKKQKKAPTPTNPQTPKSRARRWLKLTAFAVAVALAFVALYLWAASRPTYKATAVNGVWDAKQEAGTRKTLRVDGVEYAFRYCPAGTFTMGSPASESGRDDDETQREVKLTRGFWMLETEVTQAMWQTVMGSNPSSFDSNILNPVETVSWEDAQEFIAKLNAGGFAPAGFEFRLPTEAEWEYACRAESETPYSWGSSLNGDKANCDGNSPYGTSTEGAYLKRTSAVGSYDANPWGLYDMHGNVWEWCSDWYDDYASGSLTNPTGPKRGSIRVLRGGSWFNCAKDCRSASRSSFVPTGRYNSSGFRLVLGRKL